MRLINTLFLACLLATSSLCAHKEKVYITLHEVDTKDDRLRIHTGGNVWIETNAIHRDVKGAFTLKEDIVLDSFNTWGYEKRWKCPYCHSYWPMKTACQNPDCPSRY